MITNFLSASTSGFDDTEILLGRPYGGCVWRSNLPFNVQILSTDSNRICAIRMYNDSYKFMFINIYIPYEDDDYRTADFVDQLNIAENLINDNNDCHIIFGGDINVDLTWDKIPLILDSFCNNIDLIPAVEHASCVVNYIFNFLYDKIWQLV